MAGPIISLDTLNRALDDVRDELCKLNLLTKRLDKVDVCLTPFYPWMVYGYYMEGSNALMSFLGWKAGNIYIPSMRLSSLLTLFGYREYFSLRHVLRHEYGHALAHKHPGLVKRSRDFTETFGGRYDRRRRVDDYSPFMHVSEYAATQPGEDFAETFALYVRNKGNIFGYLHRAGVFMKLLFVNNLTEKLAEAAQ
jgi:hypothetical protein